MNKRMVQVFLYEFKRNVRRKGYLFATFGIPFLGLILMFGFQTVSQLVTNDDPAMAQRFFLEGLNRVGYVDGTGILSQPEGKVGEHIIEYPDVETVQSDLDKGALDAYYVIPADFLTTGKATEYLADMSLTRISSEPLRQLLLENIGSDIEPEILTRLQSPSTLRTTNLTREIEGDSSSLLEADLLLVYVFSIVYLMAIFMTNGYLMQSIIEEKESHLIEILLSSLKPIELLTGKILALGLLGLIQVVVWITTMFVTTQLAGNLSALATTILAQIEFPVDKLPAMLAYLLLGYLFFAGGYAMMGAITGSTRSAQQFIAVLVIPAIIPFYFFTLIASSPNQPIPILLSMIPITAPLAMIMRLSVTVVPLEQILLSLAILLVSVIGMIWLTARVFRFQILLAGQMPGLRDLPKLIRQQ